VAIEFNEPTDKEWDFMREMTIKEILALAERWMIPPHILLEHRHKLRQAVKKAQRK